MNVSIVIPTYNRKPILKKCLKALENQNLNENISNYEVIVVDDGSTDGTTSVSYTHLTLPTNREV